MSLRKRSLLWTGIQFVIVMALVSVVELTSGDDISLKAQLLIAGTYAPLSGALFYALGTYLDRRRST